MVVGIVLTAYVAGFRFERAVLRIHPLGAVQGTIIVNRLAESDARARLSLGGSYYVHPRDFEAQLFVNEGAVTAEYIVYRGTRIVRRASGSAVAGERLTLTGGMFSTQPRTEKAPRRGRVDTPDLQSRRGTTS